MLEQETETVITTIEQHTIGTGKSVAIKDILAGDIPHSIKTFFRADIEALLLSELKHHQKESCFAFDLPDVRQLQGQINSILIMHYTFQRDEFLQRLNDTVHMMVNYLIRPQWTLTNVLFEEYETIPSSTLIRMLRYFGPYEYLKEIIIQYVNEKQITQITKDEFALLLWKADTGFIRRKTGDELARILSPMYDFFDYPEKTATLALPIKALIKYFEDKGLTSAISQLEGESAQERHTLTCGELSEILEAARRTYGAFETTHITGDREESLVEDTAPTLTSYTQPGNGEPHHATVQRFELAIGEGESRKFIKKIFQQDDNAFRMAIQTLSTISTWKQASKFIDELFIQNNIDPYSSDAERFIEIIFQQYHPT